MKFAAVQAAQARAGRADRDAPPARAAPARAARGRARAARARVRAAVLRRAAPPSGSTGATVVAVDTSATACRRRGRFEQREALARDAVAQAPAGDQVGVVAFADAADVRGEADRRSRAGGARRSTRVRRATARPGTAPALAAASQALDRPPRARSSSSPTCRRADGTRATRRAVPESARDRDRRRGRRCAPNLAVAAVRVDGDRVVASIRNSGSAGARGARAPDARRPARRRHRRRPCRPNGSAEVDARGRGPRGGRRGRRSTIPTGSRRTTSATPCSIARIAPGVLVVTGDRRSRTRRVLRATGADGRGAATARRSR